MSTALGKTNTKNPNAAATQSGAELLVKNLEAQGVEYIGPEENCQFGNLV
jgi:hypothetical protein